MQRSPKAGTHPVPTATNDNTPVVGADPRVRPLTTEPETKNQELTTKNFPPITIDDIMNAGYLPRHVTRYKFARDQITGAVYAFDKLGPFILDEDGDETFHISPDRIAGYGNAPFQTFDESDIPDKPARKRLRLFTGPPAAHPPGRGAPTCAPSPAMCGLTPIMPLATLGP